MRYKTPAALEMAVREAYPELFKKLAGQTALPAELADLTVAETLTAKLFDPVLSGNCAGMRWRHESQEWIR